MCRLRHLRRRLPEKRHCDLIKTKAAPDEAVRRCSPDGSWVNFSTVMRSGQRLNVYLRSVSSVQYRDGTAMLIVLLPGGSVGT